MQLRKRTVRGKKYWFIDYYEEHGNRRRSHLKGISSRKAAEVKFHEFALEHERKGVDLPTNENLRLETALSFEIEKRQENGIVVSWYKSLRCYEKNLLRGFGRQRKIKTINEKAIAKYRDARTEAGASTEMLNKELSLLAAAGRTAVESKTIPKLPWKKVIRAVDREGKESWTYLDQDEVARLLNVLMNGYTKTVKRRNGRNYELRVDPDQRLYRMIVLMLNTGARRGEVFQLKWSDVEKRSQTIRLVSTKAARAGQKSMPSVRRVPMNRALGELFDSMPRCEPEGLVFGKDHNLRRKFQAVLPHAGIGKCRIHDLRHTFASHLAMAGVPILEISRLMGHSSVKITQRYAHLSPKTLLSAVDRLNYVAGGENFRFSELRNASAEQLLAPA